MENRRRTRGLKLERPPTPDAFCGLYLVVTRTHQRVFQLAWVHQILRVHYVLPIMRFNQTGRIDGEMMIHFPGHRDNPGVFLFPGIRVCLGCGLSRLTVPETELASITGLTLENESYTSKESAGDVAPPLRIAS